jgi:hypothetical protein
LKPIRQVLVEDRVVDVEDRARCLRQPRVDARVHVDHGVDAALPERFPVLDLARDEERFVGVDGDDLHGLECLTACARTTRTPLPSLRAAVSGAILSLG